MARPAFHNEIPQVFACEQTLLVVKFPMNSGIDTAFAGFRNCVPEVILSTSA